VGHFVSGPLNNERACPALKELTVHALPERFDRRGATDESLRRLQVNQDAAFHRSDRKSWPKGNPDNSFVGWVKGASRHLAFARCRCLAARLPPATSRCAGR